MSSGNGSWVGRKCRSAAAATPLGASSSRVVLKTSSYASSNLLQTNVEHGSDSSFDWTDTEEELDYTLPKEVEATRLGHKDDSDSEDNRRGDEAETDDEDYKLAVRDSIRDEGEREAKMSAYEQNKKQNDFVDEWLTPFKMSTKKMNPLSRRNKRAQSLHATRRKGRMSLRSQMTMNDLARNRFPCFIQVCWSSMSACRIF